MITNINEDFILNEVKKRDYQDMLIFMFQNSKLTQITTIIGNIIEYLKNPRNYVKDVKTNLKDMLDKYNAKPKGSKRQKNELAKILDSKANYFIDLTNYLKNKEKPVAIPQIEEEEEPDLADHYFRNRLNKDIESLSDLVILDSNHINALQLFYRIADDSEKYSVFNKKDTAQIQSLVKSLTNNIDSHKNNEASDNINNLMQFENIRRKTNIETMRKIAESNQEGQQLLDAYNKSSTIDANQLKKFGLLNDDFTAENLYDYYNRAINPKDDSDIRVKKLVLQLHDAIRETNIFEETTEPKNKKKLKQLIKYIKENGDREIFFNMNSDSQSSDDNNVDNEYFSIPKSMSKPVFKSPSKKPVLSSENYEDLFNVDIAAPEGVSPIDTAEFKSNYMQSVPTGKRAGKTFEASQKRLNDLYIFENKQSIDVSKFRGELFDILINGNYRIKFSPKCATRDGAEAYCKKKFDKNGYPLYRLIPARRDTLDPLGNPICDLNGDKVEDIVIVDTRGKPVIINGFRLVKADPYKKLWQTERIAGKTNDSFEVWMKNLTGTTKTWNYKQKQWDAGKIDVKYDGDFIKAVNAYQKVGLSKPKVSTKLNARGLWSSIFSKIWQLALYNMFGGEVEIDGESVNYQFMEPLKGIFSYLKTCTAVFILQYELQVMKSHECNDWNEWVKYKKVHSKAVNSELGLKIQEDYNTNMKDVIPIGGEINGEAEISERLGEILSQTIKLIAKVGLGYTEEKKGRFVQLAQKILENKATKEEKKHLREQFGSNIDKHINLKVGGNYIEVKNLYKSLYDDYRDKTYIKSRTDEKLANVESDDDDSEAEA